MNVLQNKPQGSPRLPAHVKNYIIDIDGVICEDIPNEQPERMKEAKELPDMKAKINKWYSQGHIITFFTARTPDLRIITEGWLAVHGFKYHNIIFGKPRGGNYHYIDDAVIWAERVNS